MKLYLVTRKQRLKNDEPYWQHVLINVPVGPGDEREYVKRNATRFLAGDLDHYTVSPLTNHGDTVFLSLSIGDGYA